jgi:hypothetical protein
MILLRDCGAVAFKLAAPQEVRIDRVSNERRDQKPDASSAFSLLILRFASVGLRQGEWTYRCFVRRWVTMNKWLFVEVIAKIFSAID